MSVEWVMSNEQVTFAVEYTDTMGGEANYSWVKRKTFKAPRNISDLSLVRKAKKELSLTGLRCDRSNLGETIQLRPRGEATVIFIWLDESL